MHRRLAIAANGTHAGLRPAAFRGHVLPQALKMGFAVLGVVMIEPKPLLEYGEGGKVRWLGLRMAARLKVQVSEIPEAYPDIGVVRPERLFAYGEGVLKERFRLLIAALVAIEPGEVVEASSDIGVV